MTTNLSDQTIPEMGDTFVPLLARDGLTVRLVGLGGVGSIVGRYLAIFLASLPCETRLIYIDGDEFERKNSARVLFGNCGNKADVLRTELAEHFVDSRLTLIAIDQLITTDNITQLLPSGMDEVIVLCVDNHATRKLVSHHCEGRNGADGLDSICLISGGNDGVGADSTGTVRRGSYGNCQVYIRRGGTGISPSLTAFHEEIEKPADSLPDQQHCTEMLDTVPQLLFTNLMTASAICNTFWLYLCDRLHYGEVAFDIADARMRALGIPGPQPGQLHASEGKLCR